MRLRWLRDDDVSSLFTIFEDPEVARYWGHAPLCDLEDATALLKEIRRMFAEERLFQRGVALVSTDAIIGTCTFGALNIANRRAELGFALARAHWGAGYMAEALRVLIRFGFVDMQLNRLTADTDPRNEPSIRTLERLGFQREGYLREHYLLHGERQDSILYGLLRLRLAENKFGSCVKVAGLEFDRWVCRVPGCISASMPLAALAWDWGIAARGARS